MLGVDVVVSPGPRIGVEVHTALSGYSRWKWRVARAPVGKGEKRKREGETGRRRGREIGTKHRWRRRYILAGSSFDRQFLVRTCGTDTASTANTRSCHRDRDHLSRGRSLLLLTGHAPHSRFRPHPERKGIIPNREGFTALGLAQRHLLRGTVLGRVRSWGIAMATYAAYRHVELDNVGYGKKRYDNMCETERERERER